MERSPRTRSGRESERHLSDIARHLILPEGITSTGFPAVRDRCSQMGHGLDLWQSDLLRCVLAKRADGQYAAGIDGVQVSIPRQVGKTYTIGGLAVAACTLDEDAFVLWTAHRTRTADETFQDMKSMVRRPRIAPHVAKVREANGQQAISFVNGSRIMFGAREQGFGRGFHGVSMIVFDEAQILGISALEDMVPAVNTAANPLIIRIGTPPRPKDPSEAFTEFRRQALAGSIRDGLYVEFSADPAASPDDRAQWRRANPSFPHRTPESAMLRMRRQLGEEAFRREGLGIWDETDAGTAIDPARWASLTVDAEDVPGGARWCAAVRFSADGSTAALARAGRVPGRRMNPVHVEMCTLRGVRPMGEGVAWIMEYLEAHRDRWAQVVVDGKSAAGDLVERLRVTGFDSRVVWTPSTGDVITAHAMFDAAVRDGTVTHLEDAELTAEVSVVTRRRIGTQGGFGWDAPEGLTSAGLDACTLALWAARTTKRRPGRKAGVMVA